MAGVCTIVLDGANVACQKDGTPSMAKLAAAIQFFRSIEKQNSGGCAVKCIAFAPNFWLNAKSGTAKENGTLEGDDLALLSALVEKDHVILTPSQAHDDFYVIDYAVKYDGFIVTNDMFRDHVSNKRIFHGMKLTSTWVKAHCIDFTFVGREFLPNPRAMERVHSYTPSALTTLPAPTSSPTTSLDAVAPRMALTKQVSSSSLTKPTTTSSSAVLSDEEDSAEEDEMLVDQRAKLKKNIDLSEVTYYKVPRHLLPYLHGEGGETMVRFQEYTGTYIVLPSLASIGATQSQPIPDYANLSIYGGESNRAHAVSVLDNFMLEMQQQYAQQQYQQQMEMQALYELQQQQQQHYHQFQHQQQQQHYAQHHSQPQHMQPVSSYNHSTVSTDEHMMDVDF